MHHRLSAARIKRSTELAKSARRSVWLSDDHGTYGNGRLVLRILAGGSQRFYYRPPRAAGRSIAISLGPYSRIKQAGYLTLTEARKLASQLAVSLDTASVSNPPKMPPQASPPQPQPQPPATVLALLEPVSAKTSPSDVSLIQLCRDYARHLIESNKSSALEVARLFERFIAPSALAVQPAQQIDPTAFTELLRDVISASSGRTAGKLRSYLHTAYARALSAKFNPSAPKSQVDYGIVSNPISGIDAMAQYLTTRNRYLSDGEFREIWRRLHLELRNSIARRGLRLCVLLGGQRAAQVVAIKVARVDLEAKTILLFDKKGRRPTARQHLLPLLPQALEEVQWLVNYAQSVNSPYLLPGSGPDSALDAGLISKEVLGIRRLMEAEDPRMEHFEFSDFRRTIETKLVALGVSKDIRAQLLSHGISGVQAKHYDRHDYSNEKLHALTLWEKYLSELVNDQQRTANT